MFKGTDVIIKVNTTNGSVYRGMWIFDGYALTETTVNKEYMLR
jgi:hypothetical protein